LKKNINETYEGKIDTTEEFSLGLDYAQAYVSTRKLLRNNGSVKLLLITYPNNVD